MLPWSTSQRLSPTISPVDATIGALCSSSCLAVRRDMYDITPAINANAPTPTRINVIHWPVVNPPSSPLSGVSTGGCSGVGSGAGSGSGCGSGCGSGRLGCWLGLRPGSGAGSGSGWFRGGLWLAASSVGEGRIDTVERVGAVARARSEQNERPDDDGAAPSKTANDSGISARTPHRLVEFSGQQHVSSFNQMYCCSVNQSNEFLEELQLTPPPIRDRPSREGPTGDSDRTS